MPANGKRVDWAAAKERIAEIGRQLQSDTGSGSAAEVLARRAARYRQREERASLDGMDVVVFHRAGSLYAASLDQLTEVRPTGTLTPLPGMSPVIRGLLNVRGRLVAVHDLAAFRGQDIELPPRAWSVIGYGAAACVALLADEIISVRRIPAAELQPLPLALSGHESCYRGVLTDGTVVLDIDGLAHHRDFFQA